MRIGSAEWNTRIVEGAQSLGQSIDSGKAEMFAIHAREMLRWNRVTNLTAITRPLDIATKHVIDSIAPASCIPQQASLLDVGSGAGFPGITLKIVSPSLSVTLVDSSHKKVSFLKHVIRTLDLQGIEAVHCRAQDLVNWEDEKAFDVVICRALTNVRSFAEMAIPLLAEGGIGIAMKGRGVETEWGRLSAGTPPESAEWKKLLKDLVFKRVDYTLPYVDSKRVLVIFERREPL